MSQNLPTIGQWRSTVAENPSAGCNLLGLWNCKHGQVIEPFAAFYEGSDGDYVDPDEEPWVGIRYESRQCDKHGLALSPPDYWATMRYTFSPSLSN